MRTILVTLIVAAACAGCTNSVAVQREAEVVASTNYDNVACGALASQRNALAARHGLATNVVRQPQSQSATPGFGVFIPDGRSAEERAKAVAIGEITAMNRSMQRRNCGAS
ncbi:hypothetical protein [Mesorhizobium sp. CAU 1732]|jgi:hypothetical protein|uniref:hypothetical protein n=1 Tax=Mesorhizobium sp. CAU 1732 TaxID=3140358 RepID=UPI0032611C2B